MATKLAKWVLSALLALILLLSALPALASSPAETGDTLPVDADLEASEPVGEVYQLTLITGDVVTVTIHGDGQRGFAISPAEPSKLGQHFLTIEQQGDTYIIPDGIDLEKLDMQLFNISYLVDEQYYELTSLPLLVGYLPGLPIAKVQSLEGRVTALGQETNWYEELSTISTRLAYENISTSYNSLVSQPEIDKIWLDKKVHAQLMDSVPLIGAPAWWGAGYNGAGAKIAILDTGIDSSHPALDDLDDNPATNDPKVVVKVNFSDDAGFDDLFGHGSHVAGIAAGTGSLTSLQNLLQNPGFENQLSSWNVSEGRAIYSTDNMVFHNGAYGVKGIETDGNSLGRLYQNVTNLVSANKTYRISGWIKTQNVIGSVVIGLDYVNANGWTPSDGYVAEIGHRSGTADWKYFESDWFTLPPMPADAVAAWFLFDFNNGTGTAWFDDVSLYELSGQLSGVAPGARLWNVKVLNRWGYGYESWIINGIKFASLGQDGLAGTGDEADIINLSLGGGRGSDGTDPMSKAVNLAVERGLIVAVAAGNDGKDGWFTIGTPGVAEKAITVGASNKDDTLAGFSSQGPTADLRIKPDILAPGVGITSSVPTNPDSVINDPSGYQKLSGTSMATPHVAGAAALLLQKYGDNATPQFIKDTLMSTAKDLGYSVYQQGSGRLDLSLPGSKVGVTPASLELNLDVYTSANTTASGNLTFFNSDNISHTVSLSANLTDVINGGDYSANVTFSTANFTVSAPPEVQWQKTFGGGGNDVGSSVQLTPDGGYIIGGYTYGAGSGDVYLIKTDASGNLTWSRTFGGLSQEESYSVQMTSDGGYIIAGTTASFGAGITDVYLIKTDASGNMTWSQTFGGANSDTAMSVQPTADGGYIIGGYTQSFGAGGWDAYLVKTDASGNMTWQKTFGGANTDTVVSIQPTADGGYIITGHTQSFGAGLADVYLIKTDASGNMTWSRTFGGANTDSASSVQPTADGGYIVAGTTSSFGTGGQDVYLVKTDASGNMTWQKTFGGASDENATSIQPTADGGYIICGDTQSFGAGMADVYLIKTDASGNMTWSQTFGGANLDAGHSVQPTADGGYIITGLTTSFGAGGYDVYLIKVAPAGVTLAPASFTIPAGGQVEVSLNVDLTSLPASGYSGKVMATVDGGASPTIHAIFGLVKVREVTVQKTDINGAPAQGHPLWVLMESPFQGMLYQWVYTDAPGNFTIYAVDGTYHILSTNWGQAENQTTIWTIAENVTIASDMTITLDERETKLVDFNPNRQVELIPAAKSSHLLYDFGGYGRYGWGNYWWYPGSFLTRVSPISRFNASFNYNAYPEPDFNPADPQMVNTGEWYNLLYSTENITGNITFVADYPNLVHRNTGYGVALKGERAAWAQWSWDNIGKYGGFKYLMDAPRQRWEWLSPTPVYYGQYHARANPWGEWYYARYGSSYLPGEYSLRLGGHPLTSGVNVGIWWNAPPPPAPQPTPTPVTPPQPPMPPASEASSAEEINRLNIYGTISRDSAGNDLLNVPARFSGRIKVTQGSDNVVLEADIWDSFGKTVYFTGNPRFTVEVWGKTPLALSGGSYTRLDFTANSTTDTRPPQLLSLRADTNLFGVARAGEVKVRVQATDESQINSVRLNYSLNDGDNWTDAGLPTFEGGFYIFNLGQLQDTFVCLNVDATDNYGNHIFRNTHDAFYVGSPGVQVRVNAPAKVIPTGNFTATIDISQVENLDAISYDVSVNATVLRLDSITSGRIGSSGNFTEIPVDIWNQTSPGRYSVVQNVPGLSGVSGSGYLAVLHFNVIGSPGQISAISLSNGMLSNTLAEAIPAAWIGDSVDTSGIAGDATQDGVIDARDITKVERIVAGLDPPAPGADANWDGNINAVDITKVERLIVGLDASFVPPRYGGVLNMVWTSPPTSFDEALGAISQAPTLHLTNEELLAGDWAKGPARLGTVVSHIEATWLYNKFPTPQTLTGSLAGSWEISGNQTLIFHIRQGVGFALNLNSEASRLVGGREMTADDVVFSFKRLWETVTSYHYLLYPWQSYFETLDGGPWIRATDRYTVEIKSLPGKLAPVYELAGDYSRIVPPEVVAKYGDMRDWRVSVGTGPFMLTDYTENVSATFVRNPLYWQKDPLHPENRLPYLDGVKYFIIPDTATQRAALRTGQIDWLGNISAWDAQGFAITNPELQYLRYLPARTMTLFMRNDTKPFDDIRVRWALSLAIDRQAIKNSYYGGNAEILTSPIAPELDFMDMYTPLDQLPQSVSELYGYNPEKAKQLLAEAGYPQGFKISVLVSAASSTAIDLAAITKAYWAAIGVDLQIDVRENAVHAAIGRAKTYTQMYMSNMFSYRPFNFSYWKPGAPSNYSLISDLYLNGKIAEIDASYFNETYRRQLMKELVPYMLEQSWMLPMPEPYVYTFWQPWLKGYHGELTVGWMNPYFPKYIWLDRN